MGVKLNKANNLREQERNSDDQPVDVSSAAGGAEVVRVLFRMRCKDVIKLIGKDHKGVYDIQSKARVTITFITCDRIDEHGHCLIEFYGTSNQVKTAKGLCKQKLKE
ncbi:hypothetical protein Tco_0160397, partial [Tanacetum coccineum]